MRSGGIEPLGVLLDGRRKRTLLTGTRVWRVRGALARRRRNQWTPGGDRRRIGHVPWLGPWGDTVGV